MCDREDCGEPNNTKPWCGVCCGHIDGTSLKLHMDREHPTPPPVDATLR